MLVIFLLFKGIVMFYFDVVNNKKVIKSDLIKAEHFFTTRDSIIKSKEPENEKIVETNKKDICNYLNIEYENLLYPSQTHTSNVQLAVLGKKEYPETDGLIVNDSNIAIFLNFADCTPIILYDEIKNIGAICHAGWRGTAGNIVTNTIKIMQNEFNCKVSDISAAIGPAICFNCYDVGEEVLEKLKLTVSDFNGLLEIRNNKIYVDLKGINAKQLKDCGVHKIDIAPFCTCCNNDLFFSYRKEHGTTNRHSAVLKIN